MIRNTIKGIFTSGLISIMSLCFINGLGAHEAQKLDKISVKYWFEWDRTKIFDEIHF